MNTTQPQSPGSLHPAVSRRASEEWLKAQCNRYVNGQCQTNGCLRRGGYVGGTPPNYDCATCEPHEILVELERQDAALRGLIKLVDDGDLVRNTDGDGNVMVFLQQGVRIANALKAANASCAKHHDEREQTE